MDKKIKIKDKKINYTLRRKRGMCHIRLAIYPNGAFVVTAPKWYPLYVINKFISEKSDWIYEKLKNIDFAELADKKKEEKNKYNAAKNLAKAIIKSRVELLNHNYNFSYSRISVKNQKSCWGSCSRKKNLNFNYKIINLPEELRDYVIIHELCHLQELNHSQNFWKLVSKTIPDHKERRKKLRHLSAGRQK